MHSAALGSTRVLRGMQLICRVSIDWRFQSAAVPPGVMTDMPFQLDAEGLYKVCPSTCCQYFNTCS